jgi:hypothetical protein
MTVNITVTIECDVCGVTMDTVWAKNPKRGRQEARRSGWSSSGGRDRCRECREAGLGYGTHANEAAPGWRP